MDMCSFVELLIEFTAHHNGIWLIQAEFQAEQEYLQTLSFLSPAEQEKYKERQGVQFLYMKPPGADSMPPPSTTNQV